MESASGGFDWTMLAGAAVMVAVLFFFGRGLPAMLRESEKAPKDWMGLVIPIVFVVVLIVLVGQML